MEHLVTEKEGVSIVSLVGDVDLESSPIAREVLLEAVGKNGPVLADLSRVDYIDSSGIASLVETLQTAKSKGHGFGLVQVSDSTQQLTMASKTRLNLCPLIQVAILKTMQ